MKIFNVDVANWIFLVILFLLAFFFREHFGKASIYNTFVWFFIILFFYFMFSGIIEKAKNEARKVIGRGVHSSVLFEERLYLGNDFYAFGLGGYNSDWIPKSKGTEGIIIVHRSQFDIVDNNLRLYGNCDIITSVQISGDWSSLIQNHFNYIPNQLLFFYPLKEEILIATDDVAFVKSLRAHLKGVSQDNNFQKQTLDKIGTTASEVVDKAGAMVETGIKSVKKGVEIVNKSNE